MKMILLAGLIAFTCFVGGCAVNETAPAVRVLSYNIHHGEGVDGKIDLPRVAEVIKRINPDVVALQEVDVTTNRAGGVDQIAELARLTGMHGQFARARAFDGGDYGQAVLSRWPIESVKVHPLPAGTEGPATQPTEERIAWVATILIPKQRQRLEFVGTHLHHANDAYRMTQARALVSLIATLSDPILVGDFNAEPGSESIRFIEQTMREAMPNELLTYPSSQPVKKIDWMFVKRASKWRGVRSDSVAETVASDHRPVVVDVQQDASR